MKHARRSETLDKRLASYGGMAAAVLASAAPAHGTVVFHDIPDVTGTSIYWNMVTPTASTGSFSSAQFRLFRNGGFNAFDTTYRTLSASGLKSNAMIKTSSFQAALRLESSSFVSGRQGFASSARLGYRQFTYVTGVGVGTLLTSSGPWGDAGSGFLGLKFDIAGNTHFGWAFLSLDNQLLPTLHAFAYENVPSASIHASQIPEPSSITLMALGFAGLLAYRKRKAA